MNNVKQIAIGRTRLSWLIVLSFTLLLVTTRTTQAQTGASHLVAPGETLTQIANRYETDVATLLRLNALSDPSLIRAGQRLAIPANVIGSGAGREYDMAPVTELGTAGESRIYLAQPGDTLASVAAAFQTTTARLTEMNQRSPSAPLASGEALRVPLPASAVFAPRTADDIPVPGKYYIHVVQEGETLAAIAAAYGTSVRRTQETNGLTGNTQIKPGQRIVVPPPSYAELFNDAPMGDNGVPEYPLVPTQEKWISVDLDHQRAYAWEGDKLLKKFAISSGKARTPTVTGVFRIRAKVSSQTMEGGSVAEGDYYNLPNVQWVQYFYQDYALHGAYWHNKFGTPTSHGCVNLTNADAKWLFDWASPTVSYRGWHFLDSSNPGTLVIVHR
jgi:lipoprotein-anchoring transpeptidase ErfK/SrfK